MQETVNIMKVALRVLSAVSEKRPPSQGDVETLRSYLGPHDSSDADELACDVIQRALSVARLKVRGQG